MYLKKDDLGAFNLIDPIDIYARMRLVIYPYGDPEYNPGSYGINIAQIEMRSVEKIKADERSGKTLGVPHSFCVVHDGEKLRLLVWPAPDKDYYAVFEYNPPRKQI